MARKPQPGWWIYKEQMDFLCHGDALWEPAPTYNYTRINIGDVGFIRRGQFHLLFSAGSPLGERQLGEDVPVTFEELTVGTPVSGQPRLPGCLRTDTIREVGAGLGATVSATPALESGAHFSFELTGNRGAALVTKYPAYREDSLLESAFEKYTKRHYESWVAFARHKQYGNNIQPVLVSGVDMTRDFAMVAYSFEGTSLESDFTIAVPALASASASVWGTWRTRCSPHTNCGPQICSPPPPERAIGFPSQSADASRVPEEFNQCVFIRYYTMRSRKLMGLFPKVIRAGAGPHDLGSGDNRGDALLELRAQSDVELTTSDDEDFEGQWDPTTEDTGSEEYIVVRNTPSDEEYDSWGAVADYIFQNSNAVSAIMNHRDLAGIRTAGDKDSVPVLLAKHRPSIAVDANGVGRIACEGTQRPIGFALQVNQEEFDQLTPEGHTSAETIPTSDSLKSYSPTNDLLSKYSKDLPVLICVMGANGSGKTTFVNRASGSDAKVGEDLKSCTSEIRQSEEFTLDGQRIILIDTPGYDEIDKTDAHVLKLVAAFLTESYSGGVKLAGVIYIHDISNPRFGGRSVRNFRMLRSLCGEATLKNVAIVTNMWEQITPEQGALREKELGHNFFRAAIEKGARLCRHYDTPESAQAVLREILKNQPAVLKIQSELIDEGKQIGQTGAGEELKQEIRDAVKRYENVTRELEEEICEAKKEKDEEARRELEEEKRKMQEVIEKLWKESAEMDLRFEEARREMEERIKGRFVHGHQTRGHTR